MENDDVAWAGTFEQWVGGSHDLLVTKRLDGAEGLTFRTRGTGAGSGPEEVGTARAGTVPDI
jgi:hypothetical protein